MYAVNAPAFLLDKARKLKECLPMLLCVGKTEKFIIGISDLKGSAQQTIHSSVTLPAE